MGSSGTITEDVQQKRHLSEEHQADSASWINGKICCYAVYEAGIYRIGFQPKYDDQDMVWMQGLEKQIGIIPLYPNAPFMGHCWHLSEDEVYAVTKCCDARDAYLFDLDVGGFDRQFHNPKPPAVYQDAVARIRARNQIQQEGPSIWVPNEF